MGRRRMAMRMMETVSSLPLPQCLSLSRWMKLIEPLVRTDGDGAHNYEEPKTFADYVRPEYT